MNAKKFAESTQKILKDLGHDLPIDHGYVLYQKLYSPEHSLNKLDVSPDAFELIEFDQVDFDQRELVKIIEAMLFWYDSVFLRWQKRELKPISKINWKIGEAGLYLSHKQAMALTMLIRLHRLHARFDPDKSFKTSSGVNEMLRLLSVRIRSVFPDAWPEHELVSDE